MLHIHPQVCRSVHEQRDRSVQNGPSRAEAWSLLSEAPHWQLTRMVAHSTDRPRLPPPLLWAIGVLCVAPAILMLLGVEFHFDPSTEGNPGAFLHTILEWSAVGVTMLTAVLALSHFHMTGAVTTVMALAMLAAAAASAGHVLFADHLLTSVTHPSQLAAISGLVARVFGLVIMTLSALLLGSRKPARARLDVKQAISLGALFLTGTLVAIWVALSGVWSPQTVFTDALLPRPYELTAVVVLSPVAAFAYARLYRQAPSFFSHALLISLIPTVASWLHMVLASRGPYDSHANIAHVLAIFAQFGPFLGLCLDHMSAHDKLQAEVVERASVEAELRKNEARTRAIVDTAADAIVLIDERGTIVSANRACHEIFGHEPRDLLGRNVMLLMEQKDREMHDRAMKRLRLGGEPRVLGLDKRQVEGLHRDGNVFPLELTANELTLDGESFFVGICRDISARVKAEGLKNEFISTVNHELRTPLTSIRGALGLVTGGLGGMLPDKAKQLVEIASRNTEQLVRLVNDILDLDQIASGELSFDVRSVEAKPLIEQSIAAIEGYAQEYDVHVSLEQTVDVVIKADSARFMQVMSNLLSNAIKFSEPEGAVFVTMERVGNRVRIAVRDRGPGIPESFHPRVFDQFTQADGSDTRRRGGTGLGLYICKTILAELGGTIDFDTSTSRGTTFFVELDGVWPDMHCARLLVCEDNLDIARLLRLMLERNGYVVDLADSVASARRMLAQHHYCAMTLDLSLPDGNGLDFLGQLDQQIPVVVISGWAVEGRVKHDCSPP